MLPLMLAIFYAIALTVLVLAVTYRLSGKAVFGTAGHTSSEFKLVLFVNAACMIDWVSAAALLQPGQHSTVSWWAFAIVNAVYIAARTLVKLFRTTAGLPPAA